MDFVAENCTRVAVFSQGEVIATGTPKEIFALDAVKEDGLGLPQTAFLTESLKEAGINVDSDLTVADFIQKTALELDRIRGEK